MSDDSDDSGVFASKHRRIDTGTSIADNFASEGLDVTESAIQTGDSASDPNRVGPALWDLTSISPAIQGSSALWQHISKWVVNSGSWDAIDITDDGRIMRMLTLPESHDRLELCWSDPLECQRQARYCRLAVAGHWRGVAFTL